MKQRQRLSGWPLSIRARLILLAIACVALGGLGGWWALGAPHQVVLGTLLVLVLAVLAAWAVSASIERPIRVIRTLALDMQQGRPVQAVATGGAECDEVARVLAQASGSIHGTQLDMEQRVEQAVALSREAEERLSHNQRLEALGRLTGGVAHDFNNLLGVISNSGHLLLRKTSDPQLTASVEVTLRAVEAGSRLTQHLLRFAGRQSVRPCVISLDAFLPEAAELEALPEQTSEGAASE